MFNNFIVGPMTLFNSMEDAKNQARDLCSEGFLPLYYLTKGKLVEDIRESLVLEQRELLKGVI